MRNFMLRMEKNLILIIKNKLNDSPFAKTWPLVIKISSITAPQFLLGEAIIC